MVAYSEKSRMISKLELNDFFFLMSSLIPGMFKSITKNINININLKLDYIVFEEACYMAKLCFYKPQNPKTPHQFVRADNIVNKGVLNSN